MPRPVSVYSELLMKKIDEHKSNVFLVNTGMNPNGKRYDLQFTRNSIKQAILNEYPLEDSSNKVMPILNDIISEIGDY